MSDKTPEEEGLEAWEKGAPVEVKRIRPSTSVLSTRLPRDLFQGLSLRAEAEGKPVSLLARELIERGLESGGPQTPAHLGSMFQRWLTESLRDVQLVTVVSPAITHDRWCEWLTEIDADLTDLAVARHVWQTVNDIIARHSSMPPSLLFDVQARNYAAAQAVAVRRQVDRDSRSVTLARLLGEIQEAPEVLSRERYVGMFDWGMQNIGDSQFDEWAGNSGRHVDPAMVVNDLDALVGATDSIRHYVTKHIAHLDEHRGEVQLPTFNDLNAAIDVLFDLFRKYGVILTGSDRARMVPVPQYDWLAPLRIPWIE